MKIKHMYLSGQQLAELRFFMQNQPLMVFIIQLKEI